VCFFQHGLTGDATQPADVFSTQANFTLRTLACRGHSASELGPVDALSIPTLAQDVIAAIEQTGGAPVVLGGISMGAVIALRIAVIRPDLVRAGDGPP